MVYVDTPIEAEREPAGYVGRARERPMWGHMIADSPDELHAMARRIGLRRAWAQVSGAGNLHYDLVPSKRALAIRYGAIACDRATFVGHLRRLRATSGPGR